MRVRAPSRGTYTPCDPFRLQLRLLQTRRAHSPMGTNLFFAVHTNSLSFVSQNCQFTFGTMVGLQQRYPVHSGGNLAVLLVYSCVDNEKGNELLNNYGGRAEKGRGGTRKMSHSTAATRTHELKMMPAAATISV